MITRHDDHVIGFIVRLYGQNRRRRRFSRPRRSRPLVRSGAVELEMKQDPRAFGSIDRTCVASTRAGFAFKTKAYCLGRGRNATRDIHDGLFEEGKSRRNGSSVSCNPVSNVGDLRFSFRKQEVKNRC